MYTYCTARTDFQLDLLDRNRRDFHCHFRIKRSNRTDLERKDRKSTLSPDSQCEDFLDNLEGMYTALDDYWKRTLHYLRNQTRRKD